MIVINKENAFLFIEILKNFQISEIFINHLDDELLVAVEVINRI